MSKIFYHQRRVEFCETDVAGIAHFSSLLQYAEQAEHAFLRSLGTSVLALGQGEQGETISWPRVRVECDFQGVARFEDELQVQLQVGRLGTTSVTYHFAIIGAHGPVSSGKLVSVCCRLDSSRPMASIPIPDGLRQQLSQYLIENQAGSR
jgi:4-hydroxybenzoyl-CoA thioesterase/acyl-CoA thioester hydrolase